MNEQKAMLQALRLSSSCVNWDYQEGFKEGWQARGKHDVGEQYPVTVPCWCGCDDNETELFGEHKE